MKTIFIIISFLLNFGLFAQMIENQEGIAFSDVPFFNTEFIKKNKIKSLKGSYSFKKAGDIIRSTPYQCEYEFNSEGFLIAYYETNFVNGKKDTIHNLYEYDTYGNLIKHLKKDQAGYQTYIYTHNKEHQIIGIENHREVLNEKNEVEKSIYFNKERIEYHKYEKQLKKITYNNHDLPYLEEILYYDSLGYLIETSKKYKMTSSINSKKFEYNEKGYLAAVRKTSNVNGIYDEEWLFKYDELGNIIEKHIYKNSKFISDVQIIYNLDTKLLSSILFRDVETNFIKILRFQKVTFFE